LIEREKNLDETQTQRPESRRLLRISDRLRTPSVLDINDDSFDREVIDSKALVVVGFWSGRHDLCQSLLDVLSQLACAYPEVKVGRVDATKSPEVVKVFDLKAVPHVAVVMAGDVVFESVGARTFEELEKVLTPFIEAAA